MEIDQERFWDLATKQLTNEASADEQAELRQYLEQPKYQQLFDWMSDQWKSYHADLVIPYDAEAELEQLHRRIKASQAGEILQPKAITIQKSRVTQIGFRAAAVILLLISIGAVMWWANRSTNATSSELAITEINPITFQVGKGQAPREFVLPDSSVVWLNAGSLLEVAHGFEDSVRKVMLQGEAFFEVKHDDLHPFVVSTGLVETKVLGTSFNVSAYQNETYTITVASGSVEVRNQQDKKIVLAPNEQVCIIDQLANWQRLEVDATKYTSWRADILWFDNSPLENVIPKLERRWGYEFDFRDDVTGTCILGGKMQIGEISRFLYSLDMIYSIDYEYDTEKKVVYLKGGECSR